MSVISEGEANLVPSEQLAAQIDEKLSALGRLGLSPHLLHEFREVLLFDDVIPSVESHALALGGLSLLVQARSAAGATETPFVEGKSEKVAILHSVQPTPAELEHVEPKVVELTVVASEEEANPSWQNTEPIVVSTETHSADELSPQAAKYLTSLLRVESLTGEVTTEQAEAMVHILFKSYCAIAKGPSSPEIAQRQLKQLLLYIKGFSDREIGAQLGISLASSQVFRSQFKSKLQEKYPNLSQTFAEVVPVSASDIETASAVLEDSEQAEPQPEETETSVDDTVSLQEVAAVPVISIAEVRDDSETTVASAPVELTRPKITQPTPVEPSQLREGVALAVQEPEINTKEGWLWHIQGIVEATWTKTDRQGLVKLLNNEVGDEVEQARYHLYSLIAIYASIRPMSNDRNASILTTLEWDTMKHIAGYNLQQSEPPAQPRYMGVRVRDAYQKQQTTFEQVFGSALKILVQNAAKDYETGWYPSNAAPTTANHEVVTQTSDVSEVLVDEVSRSIANSVRKLVGSTRLDDQQIDTLTHHLLGRQTDVSEEKLLRITTVLYDKVARAHQAAIRARNNGGNSQTITSAQNEILTALLGDISPYRSPLTVAELVARRSKDDRTRTTASQITSEISKALRTTARH
jgi:hypothetical protein